MNQEQLKGKIYQFIKSYFGGANVVWGQTKFVDKGTSQITLTMGAIIRHYQSIKMNVNGVPIDCYPSKTMLQVDLRTMGKKTEDEADATSSMINTAVSDLTEFVNFINSDYGSDWCDSHNVSILCKRIDNLTDVINDSAWDYRAMVELEVYFTQIAVGNAGMMFEGGLPFHCNGMPKYDEYGYALDRYGNRIQGRPPLPIGGDGMPIYPDADHTSSGGRTQELADGSTGYFEQVEIKEEIIDVE